MTRSTLKCFLPAWLFGWVAAVFVPSLLIAYLGLSPAAAAIGTGLDDLPATAWKVADDVGPAAKLMLGGLLLAGFLLTDRIAAASPARYALAIATGLAATVATIALLPAAYSRGFGIGLTGARFDPAVLPIYLGGGIFAGVAFIVAIGRCQPIGLNKSVS